MKKRISFLFVILIVATMTAFSACGIVAFAQSEVVSYEEYLHDYNDNVTYLLRYSTEGGYSITHIGTGVVCEYDDFNNSPYDGKTGKLYYGGPGAYLSMPLKLVGKITPMQYFGITIEENEQLNSINNSFVVQANAMSTFTVTSNDGYTLINNYNALENYGAIANNTQGAVAIYYLLRFFNDYLGGNCVQNGVSTNTLYNNIASLFDSSETGNLQICQALKECMISYMNIYTPNANLSVTYTIISPRSEIISRIGANKPSILVMTNSYSDSKCNVVYGYSGNYYRISNNYSVSYNVNRSYVYGGVFLG